MTLDGASPPEYLVGHVEDALARDPRVNEQGLHVELREATVVVTGVVTSAMQQRNIAEVVAELLPEHGVEDRTTVADYAEDGQVEEVP
ncbi:MAG TPA: BON domain-containing protein [Acidimicrobiales bacterium]|nr:BON domain-containing protein [Acidimicrobiales bacterium]